MREFSLKYKITKNLIKKNRISECSEHSGLSSSNRIKFADTLRAIDLRATI